MSNTLSGANATASSTGGITTRTPTGRVNAANVKNPNVQAAPAKTTSSWQGRKVKKTQQTAESLTWSKNFDPSRSLLNQIRQT